MYMNQVAVYEPTHSGLHGALGKAGCVRNRLQADTDCLGTAAERLAPQMQINQIGRGRMIVPDQVAHQDI